MNFDWQDYQEIFPERYTQIGEFDIFLEKFLNERPDIKRVLDLGGGVNGTSVLKNKDLEVLFLDPYVKPPDWVSEITSWYNVHSYNAKADLVVMRGSMNYLYPEELEEINSQYSHIMANTFIDAPPAKWRVRPYKNGLEMAKLNKMNEIEHILLDTSKNEVVAEHSFFYYRPDYIKQIFLNVEEYKYNKNSVIYYR